MIFKCDSIIILKLVLLLPVLLLVQVVLVLVQLVSDRRRGELLENHVATQVHRHFYDLMQSFEEICHLDFFAVYYFAFRFLKVVRVAHKIPVDSVSNNTKNFVIKKVFI